MSRSFSHITRSLRGIAPAALLALAGLVGTAHAAPVTDEFTYQGQIMDGGTAANGSYDLRFRLYDSAGGATQVGAQVARTVTVTNGVFTTPLQFAGALNGTALWLEIDARPTGGGAFTTLGPRQPLTASPFSAWSITAGTATNATTAANSLNFNGQAPAFYTNASNLSTGTIPAARLSGAYTNALTLNNAGNVFAGNGAALTGLSASNLSAGTISDLRLSPNVALLSATQTFTGANTFNVASTPLTITDTVAGGHTVSLSSLGGTSLNINNNGAALIAYGVAGNIDGTATKYGARFDLAGATGAGYSFYTLNSTPIGRGIYANMSGTGASAGVYVINNSTTGYGGYFNNTATSGITYGLYCENNSTDGYGLYALHDASTGTGPAVYARTDSTSSSAYAIHGIVSSASAPGSSAGVRGENNGVGYGVWGSSDGGGYGVYGSATPASPTDNTYGGYFYGGTSSNARGVYAHASGGSSVYGYNSGDGDGIRGYSVSGYGGYFDTGVSGGAALYVVGTASVGVITIRGGADLAENFEVQNPAELKPGMLVMIDDEHPGSMEIAVGAYNRRVAGVISGANELKPGMTLGEFEGQKDAKPIALSGRVWTYVDASEKEVLPGDLLTTSDTPGYAMPVLDDSRAHGASIGKAMSRLSRGEKGMVLVLVNLQ